MRDKGGCGRRSIWAGEDARRELTPIGRWRQGSTRLYRLLAAEGFHTRGQAGLVAGGGVLMDHALVDCLVEGRDRLAIDFAGPVLVALRDRLAESAQRRAQAGGVGSVDSG